MVKWLLKIFKRKPQEPIVVKLEISGPVEVHLHGASQTYRQEETPRSRNEDTGISSDRDDATAFPDVSLFSDGPSIGQFGQDVEDS
jgi:hypothetical protein